MANPPHYSTRSFFERDVGMIAIGQIAKSNGLRGEVRIRALTDDLQRFSKLKAVWVGKEENGVRRFPVQSIRFHRSQVIMKMESVESRTAADELRGQLVFVRETETVRPAKGSYFIHDIVGMEISTEEGVRVGTVSEVWQLPANDVWVVHQNGKEILVPAIKEVIRSVDVKCRAIVIHAMEGLFD